MRLHVLATGSRANCCLLESREESLLLDAGLSIRRMVPFLPDLRRVAGCLLTHEHGDHARSAAELARRGVMTLCSAGTKQALGEPLLREVPALATRALGGFTVMPFETEHDAAEPFGFLIREDRTGETALYATDTGYLRYTFPGVTYWIVECNYCEDRLENTDATGALRRRLFTTHLSLRRLKDALSENDLTNTAKIVLVHLSDLRSDERRMVAEIEALTQVDTVAARDGASILLERTPF